LPDITEHDWATKNLGARSEALTRDEWYATAHPAQYPVCTPKPTWLVLGGRGAGKTRLGTEWVNAVVRGLPPFGQENRDMRIALIGETLGDVREVMIEGPSGLMAQARQNRPRFEAGRRRLVWDSGAVAYAFSSEDPESLRGPQFHAAWCDELAKWRHPQACFDMLQFGLRLGERPAQIITTTPRPLPLVKALIADPDVTVTRLKTSDNRANLATGFIDAIRKRYAGTRLERQELDGELIEDRDGALWSRAQIETAKPTERLELMRIVVAVDPPASSGKSADACGIVVAGLAGDGRAVVLEDATVQGLKPQGWAARIVEIFHRHEADCVVAEVNQGGDMVGAVLAAIDASLPVKPVRASRGKWLRAEPVAALYHQGKVVHARRFPELEDEMCDFGPEGLSNGRSPDRLDALVWALNELLLGRGREPRIRKLT